MGAGLGGSCLAVQREVEIKTQLLPGGGPSRPQWLTLAAPLYVDRSHWTGCRMAFPWSSNAFILKGRRESGTGSQIGRKGL